MEEMSRLQEEGNMLKNKSYLVTFHASILAYKLFSGHSYLDLI